MREEGRKKGRRGEEKRREGGVIKKGRQERGRGDQKEEVYKRFFPIPGTLKVGITKLTQNKKTQFWVDISLWSKDSSEFADTAHSCRGCDKCKRKERQCSRKKPEFHTARLTPFTFGYRSNYYVATFVHQDHWSSDIEVWGAGWSQSEDSWLPVGDKINTELRGHYQKFLL